MQTKMIVNRMNDWFQIEDIELNVCNVAMNMLYRLSRRQIQGFEYDRVKLAYEILDRKSAETIKAIDDTICVLVSRNLIIFKEETQGRQKIMITELGKKALKKYEELIKNET